jgi:hypothetical protein
MKRGMIGLTVRPFNGWLSPKLATTSAGVVTNFTGFTENPACNLATRSSNNAP